MQTSLTLTTHLLLLVSSSGFFLISTLVVFQIVISSMNFLAKQLLFASQRNELLSFTPSKSLSQKGTIIADFFLVPRFL